MSFVNPSGLRRTRSENFSDEEIKVLVREYDARKEQVNNPSESLIAWLAIASHVTAVSGIVRNVKQCKVKLANLNSQHTSAATAAFQGSSETSSRQPQGPCLFCSEPVDIQSNHCLTKDLAGSLCEVLRLKSTRFLNFELQLLNSSLCPNCFDKATEAQHAIEELAKINERIELLSTAIEKSIILGAKHQQTVVQPHVLPEKETDSCNPAKLRLSIIKALKLDLTLYEVDDKLNDPTESNSVTSLHSGAQGQENLDDDLEFEAISSAPSPEIENSDDMDVEQDPDDHNSTPYPVIRTDIFEEAENPQVFNYEEVEDLLTLPAEGNNASNSTFSTVPKDPLQLEIFGCEDSTEYQGRNRNFTPKELKALVVEYIKRREILEARDSELNAHTKRSLWVEIASVVTSTEGIHRNVLQCKKKFSNIKNAYGDVAEYLNSLSKNSTDRESRIKRAKNNTDSLNQMHYDAMDSTSSEAGNFESTTFRRNRNFTPTEVKGLLVEYEKRKDSLESLTTIIPNSVKLASWNEIARLVTTIEGIPRDVKQCRKKFDGLKRIGISECLENYSNIVYDESKARSQVSNDLLNDSYEVLDSSGSRIKRNRNFSPEEVKGLLIEYEKRFAAYEAQAEPLPQATKQKLWEEIATVVTSISGVSRDVKQCRKKFEALKGARMEEYLKNLSGVDYEEGNPEEMNWILNETFDESSCEVGITQRTRNKNFTPKEVKCLLVEYMKKKAALENPATPKILKQSLWEEISALVTSISEISRNVEQCKKKLEALKFSGISECLQTLSHIEYDSASVEISQVITNANEDDDELEEVNYLQLDSVSNDEPFEDYTTMEVEDCTELEFRKSRGKNFTSKELKAFLIEYEKRKAILEGPGASNDAKKLGLWAEIAIIVSSIEGVPRSVMHFKKKLNNLKQQGDISAHLLSLADVEYDESLAPRNILLVQVPSTSSNAESTSISSNCNSTQKEALVEIIDRNVDKRDEFSSIEAQSVTHDDDMADQMSWDDNDTDAQMEIRRNKNFTQKEVKAFLVEYERRKEPLEGPGPAYLGKKLELWKEIAAIVSSVEGNHRDVDQCKLKLKNSKAQCGGDLSGLLESLAHVEYDEDDLESSKTRRNLNFSPKEIKCLIIECEKRKVAKPGDNKTEIWEEVASIVSLIEGTTRSAIQVKRKYSAIKGRTAEWLKSLSHIEYDETLYQNLVPTSTDEVISRDKDVKRSSNFTPKENKALVVEYEKRKTLLQEKITNPQRFPKCDKRSKENLWEEMAVIVSSMEGILRTVSQCKKRITNLRGTSNGGLSGYLQSLRDVEYDDSSIDLNELRVKYAEDTLKCASSGEEGASDLEPRRITVKRNRNFTERETKAFIVEYQKRKEILEDPSSRISGQNMSLWEDIAYILSSVEGIDRDVDQCKTKLRNLRGLYGEDLASYLEGFSHIEYESKPASAMPVFTKPEVALLLEEYKKRKLTLAPHLSSESENTETWNEIAELVTAVSGVQRTGDQCRRRVLSSQHTNRTRRSVRRRSENVTGTCLHSLFIRG